MSSMRSCVILRSGIDEILDDDACMGNALDVTHFRQSVERIHELGSNSRFDICGLGTPAALSAPPAPPNLPIE